ncbi:unnamed protein product [Cladocopium goreaui]|uniref:Uncharacterized protein n=1 Tax=Cladocopium goreaui TaxID=2562237 RepID=A0A9P1CS36_9DINO|nr:unnamed protein product [Cladocopium goreaui]
MRTQVHKVTWYMLHYGGATPKRHYCLANSPHVAGLWVDKLRNWKQQLEKLKASGKAKSLVIKYIDKGGKKRWKGSKLLRSSENYPPRFGLRLVDLWHRLSSEKYGMPALPKEVPPAHELEAMLETAHLQEAKATPQRELVNKSVAEAETQPASEEELLKLGLGGSDDGSVKGKTRVTNRIMAMWRGGQLDGDMAMQLLGLQLTTGSSSATSNLEAGEENALKAKLRRLCEPKKNGQLQVPQWLHDQWKNGDHMAMAKQLAQCNFDKEAFIKFKEKSLTKNDKTVSDLEMGWYSRDDMLKVLKWNTKKIDGAIKCCEQDQANLVRRCAYGGDDEYYVRVRETGNRQHEKISSEVTRENAQEPEMDCTASLPDVSASDADQVETRLRATTAGTVVATSQANRSKDTFRKYIDSVLQKSAKIRGLIGDLRKNYCEDEHAKKSIEALDQDLATLDNEYNTLSEHMAKGEQDDFNPEWFGNLMVGKGSRGKDESIDFHVAH